jgi:hypothetical protein
MEGEIMRLLICLMALLCGCAKPVVRCDTHLQPINAPVASAEANSAPSGAAKAATARRTP